MIKVLLFLKHKFSFLWNIIFHLNGLFFHLIWGRCVSENTQNVLSGCSDPLFDFRLIRSDELGKLYSFLHNQPEDSFIYFKPHAFDLHTLQSLFCNRAFLMLGVFDKKEEIIGYFFLRLFVNKSAFRGKIVDISYQKKGVAKQIGAITSEICLKSGFRLFATISKDNVSSIHSSKAVNDIRVVKKLPDNYMYVEYLKKTTVNALP